MPLRNMTYKDLKDIANLYTSANPFSNEEDVLKWTKRGLKKYPSFNFVYEIKGRIVGAVSVVLDKEGEAILNDISVKESYRSKKIGQSSMRYTLKYLKKQKIRKVSLYVNWPNARAIPFYYLFGFKITRLSIKKGEGEIIWMKKHL